MFRVELPSSAVRIVCEILIELEFIDRLGSLGKTSMGNVIVARVMRRGLPGKFGFRVDVSRTAGDVTQVHRFVVEEADGWFVGDMVKTKRELTRAFRASTNLVLANLSSGGGVEDFLAPTPDDGWDLIEYEPPVFASI